MYKQVFEALVSGLVCLLWAILGNFPVKFYMLIYMNKFMVSMKNIHHSSIQMIDEQLMKTFTDVKTGK